MINIPNYEIGKLAGRGGVAEVYLARHKLLDRTVAIKLISPVHEGDLADKRFLKEAKVVAGLRHPNIVSIYDVGVYENKYYIIMEYLEGGDLKQNIKRDLSVEQALKIMRQIASALAHAHDKGFIHRDIKSQNIMFRGDGTAVLTDFGIVKDLAADTGYTMDGTSIGTPHYMSPEQAQGADGIDWRTDLYSLGVTFYEMLTGSLPYNADSPIAVALKHIKDPVPQLPEQFARFQPIISRLMAKDPKDRYQSAHELILAIDRFDRHDRLDSEGDAPTYPFLLPRKSGRKVNLVNIFLGVLIGCVACGIALFAVPYLSDMIHPSQAPVETAQPSAGSPFKPGAQAKKTAFMETIKKKWSNTADLEQLIGMMEQKDYPKALNYIVTARNKLREPPNEMVQKADQLIEAKQIQNAGETYNTVLSVEPGNQRAMLGLLYVIVLKQQELSKNEKSTAGEYDALLMLLNKGIESTHSQVLEYVKTAAVASVVESAQGQLAQNHFQEAGTWSKTGLKYAPEEARLKRLDYLIAARQRFNEGRIAPPDPDNALSYYQKILQMDPNDPDAKQGVAAIYVMMPLYQVRQKGPLAEKLSAYRTLFSNLKSAVALQGEDALADAKRKVMEQVREDIAAQKSRKQPIPAEFLALVAEHFPDETDMSSSPFDILIAKGDESVSFKEKADYYLKALKLEPSSSSAQRKIENMAKSLDDAGKPEDAQAILNQAIDIAPDQRAFNDMLQDIKQLQSIKAEVAAQLLKIKQNKPIIEKIGPYAALFEAMNKAAKRYGSKKLPNLTRDVKTQVQTDIQAEKAGGRLIPDEFLALLKKYFPEMHKSAMTTQYDALIGKGDKGSSNQEAAGYYLKALKLDKNRGDAKNRIELLIKDMDANGDASGSADLLSQATQIMPNELIFAELSGKMESHVEVFATASGCGKENRITLASVSIENLTICIYYKNMPSDSVVNIVIQQRGGKAMEAPLILDGRSGNKLIDIMAPIEGFVVGEYTISVKQGGKILSETQIQLTPKRR